jgi:DNA-binding CsgD family transcriptional regulator
MKKLLLVGLLAAGAALAQTPSLEAAVAAIRGRTGGQSRPTYGWDSLTDAERKVVDLVAEGLTNPQIGQRLYVSPRTVQTHLAHVFAKLNVSTRAELAALAAHRAAERSPR